MSTASAMLRRRHAVTERLGAYNRGKLSGALTLSHGPSGWGEVGTVAIVEALAIRLAAAMRILNHASDRPRQLAAESGRFPTPGGLPRCWWSHLQGNRPGPAPAFTDPAYCNRRGVRAFGVPMRATIP